MSVIAILTSIRIESAPKRKKKKINNFEAPALLLDRLTIVSIFIHLMCMAVSI